MTSPAAQVSQLASWLAGTDIVRLELTTADGTIRLTRSLKSLTGEGSARLADEPSPFPARSEAEGTVVTARSVGIFHHGHPLRPRPLVQPGDRVQAGQAIGLLRVGMLLLTVTAPAGGTILQHLAVDGATIGYGTPLLRLQRSDPA